MHLVSKNAAINRSMWAVTLFVLGLIWLAEIAFFQLYQADLVDGKRQELVQMNNVVAQHTAALFRSVETDLNVLSWQLQGEHGKDPLHDPFFLGLVARLRNNADGLIDIRLVSADGNAYAVPPLRDVPFANIQDREYFKTALAGDTTHIRMGRPIIARLTGRWIIPVSLKLPSDVPNYRLLIAAIDIGRLLSVQETWRISRHGSIVLMRDDATVLSRAPFNKNLLGLKLSNSRAFRERAAHPSGTYFTDSPLSDGVKRFVSYIYLDEFRLFVTVTRGYDEALEPFYKIRRYVFCGTALITLCLLCAAWAIHRAQQALLRIQQNYQRQALVDELTRVMNRRALLNRAEDVLSLTRRQGGDMAALMIDIDHFKRINDRFGHAAGDAILKSASRLWRSALRRQDLLGRLGGEEFGIILPATSLEVACEVAERLRSLTEQQIAIGPERERCSISIGVAVSVGACDQVADLLRRADTALYRAKQKGRNRVEVDTGQAAEFD